MKLNKNILLIALAIVLLILINKQCEKPKEVVKTEIDIEWIKDSIKQSMVNDVKVVYIDTSKSEIKWLKGDVEIQYKDSIVYVDKPNDSTIQANQYDTTLKSNDATAEVKITTTGELLDISGIITYPKIKETTTIVKNRDKSGLFIYADLPVTNNFNPEVGAIYQFKNTALIKSGVQYNEFTKSIDVKIGIGIKIF
jgi:hypothetical protein